MKTQKSTFPFVSVFDRSVSRLPMHRQIYEKMRQAILSGEMPAKSNVPSSRSLAAQLGVSRMTIVNAYDQLFAEGYLESKVGSGTFVARVLPEDLLQTPESRVIKKAIFSRELNLSRQGKQMAQKRGELLRDHSANAFVPFQNGSTAIDSFPFDTWARIATRLIRHTNPHALANGNLAGFYPLREAIVSHLKSARGLSCEPEQVIITAGARQALSLITSIFLDPNDDVWMEDPGYTSARNLFSLSRAKLIPIPVHRDGLDLVSASKLSKNPKLIYVTPSHQYPLGSTMSVARRLALIETARQAGAWIIEDDYDSEYRYAGHPLASLQGLDPHGRVLYIGTFSKTIFPSLKLGCLVVPPDLIEVFTAARTLHGAHSPLIEQAVLAEFIAEGHFARHIRRMRTLYQERQEILIDEVRRNLGGLVEIEADDAGMHLVGWLPDNFDDQKVAQKAADLNIRLSAISDHCIKKFPRAGLVFGYAAFNEKQIRSGVSTLAEILTEMAHYKNGSKAGFPLSPNIGGQDSGGITP